MGSDLMRSQSGAIARPLAVLAPLIRADLDSGDKAGLEHYRAAGEKLHEARQLYDEAGPFWEWAQGEFGRKKVQLRNYMSLANIDTTSAPSTRNGKPGNSLRSVVPQGNSKVSWQVPVQRVISTINFAALSRERKDREQEAALQRQLAMKLIQIGYRVLSQKLHPDKSGGSKQAMQRLNEVKRRLTEAIQ